MIGDHLPAAARGATTDTVTSVQTSDTSATQPSRSPSCVFQSSAPVAGASHRALDRSAVAGEAVGTDAAASSESSALFSSHPAATPSNTSTSSNSTASHCHPQRPGTSSPAAVPRFEYHEQFLDFQRQAHEYLAMTNSPSSSDDHDHTPRRKLLLRPLSSSSSRSRSRSASPAPAASSRPPSAGGQLPPLQSPPSPSAAAAGYRHHAAPFDDILHTAKKGSAALQPVKLKNPSVDFGNPTNVTGLGAGLQTPAKLVTTKPGSSKPGAGFVSSSSSLLPSPAAASPSGVPLPSVAVTGSNPGSMLHPSQSEATSSAGTPSGGTAPHRGMQHAWTVMDSSFDRDTSKPSALAGAASSFRPHEPERRGGALASPPSTSNDDSEASISTSHVFSINLFSMPHVAPTQKVGSTSGAHGGPARPAPAALPARPPRKAQPARRPSGPDAGFVKLQQGTIDVVESGSDMSRQPSALMSDAQVPAPRGPQPIVMRSASGDADDDEQHGPMERTILDVPLDSPGGHRHRHVVHLGGNSSVPEDHPTDTFESRRFQGYNYADSAVIQGEGTRDFSAGPDVWNGPVAMQPITPATSILVPPVARGSTLGSDGEGQWGNMEAYVQAAQARIRAQMSRAPSSETIRTDTTPFLGTPGMPDIAMAQARMAAGRHAPKEPEGFRLRSSPLQRRLELPESNVVKPGDMIPKAFTSTQAPRLAAGQKATLPSTAFEL